VTYDMMSYTSDYFELIIKKAEFLIEKGLAYCDDTPLEQMRKERFDGIESQRRNTSIEENLHIFRSM